ncbi:uncharacterized protein LOC110933043 [Helianthus annuus]|uniref:uncharacterized protein LOC110933043 n=1 Tax=Helianthus annuus TaxID=4232 RepID=UPI000B8F76A8|nr:uncharacterized protein LOC110933043 [Helianthus annuus]
MVLKITAWNVRGPSNAANQNALKRHLASDDYKVCGALETHLSQVKLQATCNHIFGSWLWDSNAGMCRGGCRIIISWDPNVVNLMVVDRHPQAMHCFIEPLDSTAGFYCTFVYAHHRMVPRRECWKMLNLHKLAVQDLPWLLLGDFNAIVDPAERSTGLKHTWNQSPGKVDGLLKKLDRAMSNHKFITEFPLAFAQFLPFLKSDHTPIVVSLPDIPSPKPKPFRFPNYLVYKTDFIPTVKNAWDKPVVGCQMYCVVSRLKALKKDLRKLNFKQGNLFEKVKKLQVELESIQTEIVLHPENQELRDEEAGFLCAYKEAVRDEELFLQQKAKVT